MRPALAGGEVAGSNIDGAAGAEAELARIVGWIRTSWPRVRSLVRAAAPTGANRVWSCDFVFDRFANGQQLKCLTVTDEWTQEGLAIEVDDRICSGRVIEVLSRLISERGAPLYLLGQRPGVRRPRALEVDGRPGNRDRADRSR
jgi:hypothetical protein